MDKLHWLGAFVLAGIMAVIVYGVLMWAIGSFNMLNLIWVDRISCFASGVVFTLTLVAIDEGFGSYY